MLSELDTEVSPPFFISILLILDRNKCVTVFHKNTQMSTPFLINTKAGLHNIPLLTGKVLSKEIFPETLGQASAEGQQ